MSANERVKRLDRIGSCLCCGVRRSKSSLNRDHYYPQCLYKYPENSSQDNPFRGVVNNWRNIFVFCRKCHERVDEWKIKALKGSNYQSFEPARLVRFLWEEYPTTENPRFYVPQLKLMLATNLNFISAAMTLNGELPRDLVRRYESAADVALDYAHALRGQLAEYKQIGFVEIVA